MVVKILRSRWFWIFLIICIVEEATFFFPFLSIFLFAAAFFPRVGMRYARIFVEYYNQVYDTKLEIVDTK